MNYLRSAKRFFLCKTLILKIQRFTNILIVSFYGCTGTVGFKSSSVLISPEKSLPNFFDRIPNMPLRNGVRINGELFLGAGYVDSSTIAIVSSSDFGRSWSRVSTFSPPQDPEFNPSGSLIGDVTTAYARNLDLLFCSFRIKNGSNRRWSVVVYRSEDRGKSWTLDAVLEKNQQRFVGAPFLMVDSRNILHIFYDSEPAAEQRGKPGHQFIVHRRKDLNNSSSSWSDISVVSSERSGLSRDGMPSGIEFGPNKFLLVYEGVEEWQNGGAHANIILSSKSFDGGKTWTRSQIIYQSPIDPKTGKRFNSYVPFVNRVGSSIYVIFSTDEEFASPSNSYDPIHIRNGQLKYFYSEDLETWSTPQSFPEVPMNFSKIYFPFIIDRGFNRPLVSFQNVGEGNFMVGR